jgi:hypothetical protein
MRRLIHAQRIVSLYVEMEFVKGQRVILCMDQIHIGVQTIVHQYVEMDIVKKEKEWGVMEIPVCGVVKIAIQTL